MPPFGPIKRLVLIRTLKRLGFNGPFSGGKHQYMRKGKLNVTIPNPHQGDIDKKLLADILREAGISREDWENI